MIANTEERSRLEESAAPPPDFSAKIELSLDAADRARHRHVVAHRATSALPVLLLIGPIIGWRLMLSSPDGVHIAVEALAWLAFLLDIGVHLDTAVLRFVNMQLLPTLVGIVLFIIIACTLLPSRRGDQ